jgi:hypothetical protein
VEERKKLVEAEEEEEFNRLLITNNPMLRTRTDSEEEKKEVVFPDSEKAALVIPVEMKHMQERWNFIDDDYCYCKPIFEQGLAARKKSLGKRLSTRKSSMTLSIHQRRRTVGENQIDELNLPQKSDLVIEDTIGMDTLGNNSLVTPSGLGSFNNVMNLPAIHMELKPDNLIIDQDEQS